MSGITVAEMWRRAIPWRNPEQRWAFLHSSYQRDYAVSTDGVVASFRWKSGSFRVLSGIPDPLGYRRVKVAGRLRKIHRVVAEAFIDNPENKPFINHVDADTSNNKVTNLEWVTPAENSKHAMQLGLVAKGADSGNAKLLPDEVAEMRRLSSSGVRSGILAERYGIHPATVRRAVRGDTWKWMQNP